MTCIDCTTPAVAALPQASAGNASNKSKEVALQRQIDAKSTEQARVTCNQTAAKIGKEIDALKGALASLQASDQKPAGTSQQQPETLASPEAAARQAEFDEHDTRAHLFA
jgi:hypothetical protein